MSRRAFSILLLASAGMAADALVMRGGQEIYGTVVSEDARAVVIEIEGRRITFDAAGVAAVRRGVSRPVAETPPPPPRPPVHRARPLASEPTSWSLTVGLGAGWLSGSVDGEGTLRNLGTGVSGPLTSSFDLGGLGLMPGIWSRLAWEPQAPGPSPLLGVQAAYGGTSGDEASSTQASLALVGGWSLPLRGCRLALLADLGIAQAGIDRTLALPGGERVDDSADLAGWTAGLAVNVCWPLGSAVDLSAELGVHHASLSGDTAWDSPTYHGSEDLSAEVTSVQAGLGLAWRW